MPLPSRFPALAGLVSTAFLSLALTGPAAADRIRNPTAVFAGLDKITGRIISFEVAVDETVQFGALQLTPRVCWTRPPTEAPQTTSFTEVDEVTFKNEYRRIFTGWMYAASPGLHGVEHAIYDVWLTDCKGGTELVVDPKEPEAPVAADMPADDTPAPTQAASGWRARLRRSLARIYSFQWRETLELRRDPVRGTLALLGSLLLMFVVGYGISMDVEDLRFAVLDRDQTALSRDYVASLAGSRYFSEQPPLRDDAMLDQRMRSGEVSLALEIPSGFARDVARGSPVQIGAWIDGAMPQRAETVLGYVQGMHLHWYTQQALARTGRAPTSLVQVETRYRYNPDVKSLPSMVPAVIPMLLLMLPAMLSALAVVREKELGSIINFYATPTTRLEFLLGKQLPYVLLAMLNYGLMCLAAVTVLGVPMTGSFVTLSAAALLFSLCATGMGLLASTITRSQIAAIFFTMVGTMLPTVQFAGLINPVSSLEGVGRLIGEIYPASHMFTISRGVFSKALNFDDLRAQFWPLLAAVPVILGLAVVVLKKQEA